MPFIFTLWFLLSCKVVWTGKYVAIMFYRREFGNSLMLNLLIQVIFYIEFEPLQIYSYCED